MSAILDIPITKIRTGRNPRKIFNDESLCELAESVKEHGLIQPITVESDGKGYILVSGERRLRAHQIAGLGTIQAVVLTSSNHNGRERFILSIVENDQRENMNGMDRGEAYQALHDEFGMSVREISIKVSKAEVVVRNFMLLTKLDEPIREMIRRGWWKDPRLAKRLHTNKVSLNGCLKACERTMELLQAAPRTSGRPPAAMRTPSLSVAATQSGMNVGESVPPRRWDMLRQVGSVPAWGEVVISATETCAVCALKDIASPASCRDCGAVVILQRLMERAR